jgi:NAD-dependent dihydropyrimidine dehydrogenase PreA subunit
MPYFIASPCIDVMDKSCIEECPVDCIYEGDRKLYINPAECIDCGACEPACPETAIYVDWKAPAGAAEFAGDNASFFAEALPGRSAPLGNPGGSGRTGRIGEDSALVRSWGER